MTRLVGIFRRMMKGGFLADVAKLSLGTLSGRLISIAVLPILTRLYSPEDFAVLATYLAVLGTIAVAACLRMDVAIPLADNDEDAVNLLALALSALTVVTLLVLLPVLAMPGTVAHWLGNPAIEPYLWLVPLGITLVGAYSAFQFWTTRARRFGHIARTRVSQSAMGALTMLSLGWAGIAPFGLLLGNALSIGAGGIGLAVGAAIKEGSKARMISLPNMKSALRRNFKYPVFTAPEAIMNVASVQIPILIIAAYAREEAGYLFIAMQLLSAPMMLVGSSVAQVFMARSAEAAKAGTLATLTLETVTKLLLVGSGAVCLLATALYLSAPLVFGSDWSRTGEIALILAPWTLVVLVASPISSVLYVQRRNGLGLLLQFLGLLFRISLVYAACVYAFLTPVSGFFISGLIPISIVSIVSLRVAGVTGQHMRTQIGTISLYVKTYMFISISIIITGCAYGILK